MRRFTLLSGLALLLVLGACSGPTGGDDSDADLQRHTDGSDADLLNPPADLPDVGPEPDLFDPDWLQPDGDGTPSPDGAGDQADGGPVAACSKDTDCEGVEIALGPCQKAVCDKHVGACVPGPKAPGEPCDDGNACSIHAVCTKQGLCLGAELVCDDGNLCTTDTCKPDKGCIYQPNDNVCDDGNSCTKNDRCEAAVCVGEPSADCDCTADADCTAFDDGNLCNGTVKCVFGVCKVPQSTVVHCPEGEDNPCVKSTCQQETGLCEPVIRDNGRPCDDGDACTVGDLCLQGLCVGSAPRSCDDGNVCTVDTCDPDTGCLNQYSVYPCDDGDDCTINDYCKWGTCVPGPSNTCNSKACFPRWPLQCGSNDLWNTAGEGSTDNVSQYSCTGDQWPGPEYTYAFVAPYDGLATATLVGDAATQSLFLLESNGVGCTGDNCRAASEGVLVFDMFEGQSVYLVVDSTVADGGDYEIMLDCLPANERFCDDGEDDDQDDLLDCADPDCQGDPACPEPTCTPLWTLQCGVQDFGANYGLGSTSAVTTYNSLADNKGCLDNQWDYTGPEFAYRFDSPGDFNVTVRLLGETAQTDLLILQDKGNGCDPTDCIAWGLKKVTFPAMAGQSYYFVIDGYAGATGKFNIEVECPPFVETACGDGLDNDLDLLTDCEDPDCGGAVNCVGFCLPARTVGCGFAEAFANFGWGSTDAIEEYACNQWVYDGPEMAYQFVAPYDTDVQVALQLENASTDVIVVEGANCDPAACLATGLDGVTFPAEKGKVYNIIVDGYQGAIGTYKITLDCIPEGEVNCGDGLDEDGDGLVDCADEADCAGTPACPGCNALYPLQCGDTEEWTTAADETTDKNSLYACTPGHYDGPEFAYTFQAPADGPVTLLLENVDWDLDVLVLEESGYGCNPANCVAWGTDSVTFDALAEQTYYVVVDGYGAAPAGSGPNFGIGDYTLSVICP